MSRVKFKLPISMGRNDGFDGALVDASSDRLVYEDGRTTVQLDGRFATDGADDTVERMKVLLDDEAFYTFKGLSADLASLAAEWEEGGHRAALRSLLDGDDRVIGSTGDDALLGGGGRDKIKGKEGDDELDGGGGRDRLIGGDGEDRMFGRGDDDKLKGGDGDDELYGGSGDDTLRGGEGSDLLYGEDGDDRLTGNQGADDFLFDGEDGRDVVRDFDEGVDRIGVYGGVDLDDVSVRSTDEGVELSFGETEVLLRGVASFDTDDIFVIG